MPMDIRPLRTEADYDCALAEIAPYFETEPAENAEAAARFAILAALIDQYESCHWPIAPPGPHAAIHARMEASGYTQADLARLLGSRSRASEILSGKRAPTLAQAWRLHYEWHIPAESLLQPARSKTV
jgi:HTH-type transcriptional regulator / antitoxin HigA